jgi:hypothetical protein
MDLFITQVSAEPRIAVADVRAEVETPVGVLRLDCVVDGEDVAENVPTRARTVGKNATLTSWRTQTVRADLLLVDLPPRRPSGPRIAGTVAAMWRLAAWRDLLTLQFDCRWVATLAGSSIGSSSSAGLEAHGWETETTKVVIGTEDRGSLIARAASADGFPARLTNLAPRTVQHVPNGLRLLLPPLARHEQCQIQFVVAWADKPDDDASFLAVQRDPAELLEAAHVL